MSQDMHFKEIKVGDYAMCHDQSYSLKLLRNNWGYPTWLRTYDDTLMRKVLKIVETDLKIPVMSNDMRNIDLDAYGHPIYLDTMVSDDGNRWLIQGRFLDIQNKGME